jgi:hypothetical protein
MCSLSEINEGYLNEFYLYLDFLTSSNSSCVINEDDDYFRIVNSIDSNIINTKRCRWLFTKESSNRFVGVIT